MEILLQIFCNPYTWIILGLISAAAFIISPYEIVFEDGDSIEI